MAARLAVLSDGWKALQAWAFLNQVIVNPLPESGDAVVLTVEAVNTRAGRRFFTSQDDSEFTMVDGAAAALSATSWESITINSIMNKITTVNGVLVAAQSDFAGHAEDKTIHLTEEERTAWNAKADASALSGKVDTGTFRAHETNATAHVTQEEREKWNARNTKGAVVATQDGLDEHVENTTVHVTTTERAAWDAAAAIPAMGNTFTGNNSHTGVETFDGPVSINNDLLLNGSSLLQTLASAALDDTIRLPLGFMPSSIGEQVASITSNMSFAAWRFFDTCIRWRVKLESDDILGGSAGCYDSIFGIDGLPNVMVATIIPDDAAGRGVPYWAWCRYDSNRPTWFYSVSREEILAPDTNFDLDRNIIYFIPIQTGLHIYTRARHEIISYDAVRNRALVSLRGSDGRIIVMTRPGSNGKWSKIYDSGPEHFSNDRNMTGALFWLDNLNEVQLNLSRLIMYNGGAARFVDAGAFDNWANL